MTSSPRDRWVSFLREFRSGSPPRWATSLLLLIVGASAAVAYIRQTGWILEQIKPIPPPPLVCIDPGHPTAFNSGRQVINGTTELEINWEVALKLEDILRERYGIRTVRTRDDRELLVSNPDRARVANEEGASVAIHLHCDAGPNEGFTIYYPDRQGEDLGVTGPSEEIISESRRAAHAVHSGMAEVLRGTLNDRGVMGERKTKVGRMQGALTCSIFSEVPTITVEMVFLTNRDDAEFIKTEGGQEHMARALANGVMGYLNMLEKEKGGRGNEKERKLGKQKELSAL